MGDRNAIFVFDFDGVIADSIKPLYNVYHEFLAEHGSTGSQEEFDILNGPKLPEIIDYLKDKHNLLEKKEKLFEEYLEKMTSIYDRVTLIDGTREALENLRSRNFTLALASSSHRQKIEHVLKKYNLMEYFSFIISGDEVTHAKPSSEIYEKVRDEFGEHDYYVVEDSHNGIAAAKGARMNTILFNPHNEAHTSDVTYEIDSLSSIAKIATEVELDCFTISEAKKIRVEFINHTPTITKEQQQKMETLWKREQEERNVYNGQVVCYHSHKKQGDELHITCYVTEYKHFFTHVKHPEVGIYAPSLAVSGIVLDPDNNTLVAKRHQVTEYDGYWELIPAGIMDPVPAPTEDMFKEHLITEFEEETTIDGTRVKKIEPLSLIYDAGHKVYDICYAIHIDGPLEELIQSTMTSESRETQVLSLKDARDRIATSDWVPTSIVLLNHMV